MESSWYALSNDTPAWKKTGNTDRWTEYFRARATCVGGSRFVSFRGTGGGDSWMQGRNPDVSRIHNCSQPGAVFRTDFMLTP
jgi:hypothetical protein